MNEAFTGLEKAAKGTNLFINQEKTKYMLPVTESCKLSSQSRSWTIQISSSS